MSEKVKKEVRELYDKYKPFFTNDFQFTLLENSVLIKNSAAFYPVPFADKDCLKMLKAFIGLRMKK